MESWLASGVEWTVRITLARFFVRTPQCSFCLSVYTLRNSLWVHTGFHLVAVALQVRPCVLWDALASTRVEPRIKEADMRAHLCC